jgi:hypothetical protein
MKQLFIRIFGKPPKEYPAILVCLFMAGVIWFFNAMNKDYTTQIKYPVHFNFDEERLTSIGELPDKLKVNVTGQGWNLLKRSLYYNVKPVEIRTAGFAGKRFLTSPDLLPSFMAQMPELKVNYVISDSILVNLNRLVTKRVQLIADTSSFKTAAGYKIQYPISITPAFTEVSGASSLIAKLPNSLKVSVPANTLTTNFEEAVPLDFKQFGNLKFKNKSVVIGIKLIKLKEISVEIPIQVINAKGQVKLSDSVATIVMIVPEELAATLKTDSISVVVDMKEVTDINKPITLKVKNLPRGLEQYSIEPATTNLEKE